MVESWYYVFRYSFWCHAMALWFVLQSNTVWLSPEPSFCMKIGLDPHHWATLVLVSVLNRLDLVIINNGLPNCVINFNIMNQLFGNQKVSKFFTFPRWASEQFRRVTKQKCKGFFADLCTNFRSTEKLEAAKVIWET